jgi:hypothetical protein
MLNVKIIVQQKIKLLVICIKHLLNDLVSHLKRYKKKFDCFPFLKKENLLQKNEQTQQVRLSIEAQKKFVDKLVELTNIVKRVQGTAKVKVSCFFWIEKEDNFDGFILGR